MRRSNHWLLPAILVLLAHALTAQSSEFWCPAEGVAYGVSFKRAEDHILHVDAVMHQPASELQLPVWNALYEVRDFSVNVNHVKVYEGVPEWMCDGCVSREGRAEKIDKSTWKLSTSGNHPCVTFSYEISLSDPGPFGAIADAQYAFLNWAEALVYRPDQRNRPVTVRLLDVPSGWAVRDGGVFGARSAEQLGGSHAEAASYDRLVDSPALFGKLYESSFDQDGASYHVVVDSPDVDLQRLSFVLRKITAAGVEWMQDRPFDEYTFLFLVAHGAGSGGMEHAQSTAIDIAPERLKQDVLSAAGVSAHEFFHLWNVKRIRPQSLEPIDYTHEQYTRALWFSEGVTSTVADILEYRAELKDERRALAHIAATIGGLEAHPARLTQSVEESSIDTWLDIYPAYHRAERSISYYPKGEILGFLIDLEMRRLTNGRRCLRDLFQYMNQRYAKQGLYFNDSEGVRLALEALTGSNFRDFFARYIAGTDELPYDLFSYVGLTLVHRQSEQPSAGISTSGAPGKPATIVRVESEAAKRAGLAAGDIVLEADGKAVAGDLNELLLHRESRGRVRLRILSTTGETREIELPLAVKKIDEYQFEELPGVNGDVRSRRAAFLRGEAEAVAR
jgi:predicted metalloprotease with PDZ domain